MKKAAELVASLPPWDQTDPGKLTNFKLIEGRFINVYQFMMWRYEPALFWGLIGLMFSLCTTGWVWMVAKEVARVTMERSKPLETVKLDFFATVALGIRFTFWPYILILPFFWFPPMWLLPLICAPIALIHFNQRYNYKAYLPVDMLKVVFRIPGPTFYVLMVTFVAFLVHLGVVGALAATGVPLKFAGWTMDLTKWAVENIWELQEGVFRRIIWEMPSIFLLAIAIFLPTFLTAGFPMLFVMRTYGLLGKYFRPELELENQKEVGKPCGFWARWLAYLIDGFVVTGLVLVFQLMLALLLAMMVKVGLDPSGFTFPLMLLQIAAQIVFPIVYFVSSESGLGQATLGKRAIGLIVVDMKGERISRSMAVSRYFGKIISALPLGAGFIMAGLDKNKQALHDKMAKTQVVWRGDDETTA